MNKLMAFLRFLCVLGGLVYVFICFPFWLIFVCIPKNIVAHFEVGDGVTNKGENK